VRGVQAQCVRGSVKRPSTATAQMPTMAMERSGSQWGRSTSSNFVSTRDNFVSTRELRRQQERQREEDERLEREALVQRAQEVSAFAQIMASQNEKMLAGLRAVAQTHEPIKVDFIARNIADVASSRSPIERSERALFARAEVMAAATAHLGADTASRPTRVLSRGRQTATPSDSSADLVRAAREEMARGYDITAFEAHTRRPPVKLRGLGPRHRAF
jgi:hypothetical protein